MNVYIHKICNVGKRFPLTSQQFMVLQESNPYLHRLIAELKFFQDCTIFSSLLNICTAKILAANDSPLVKHLLSVAGDYCVCNGSYNCKTYLL